SGLTKKSRTSPTASKTKLIPAMTHSLLIQRLLPSRPLFGALLAFSTICSTLIASAEPLDELCFNCSFILSKSVDKKGGNTGHNQSYTGYDAGVMFQGMPV